jgi:hypothetical protein
MIEKDESDSHKPITNNTLKQAKELNSKESGPLTEHYGIKGFTEVDDSKKTQDYNIY